MSNYVYRPDAYHLARLDELCRTSGMTPGQIIDFCIDAAHVQMHEAGIRVQQMQQHMPPAAAPKMTTPKKSRTSRHKQKKARHKRGDADA